MILQEFKGKSNYYRFWIFGLKVKALIVIQDYKGKGEPQSLILFESIIVERFPIDVTCISNHRN